MSQPPTNRQDDHRQRVMNAVAGFYARQQAQTLPEGRIGGRSANSGGLAQRMGRESERPDRPCGGDGK